MPRRTTARHRALPRRPLPSFPPLNLEGCRALHVDGHQGDAAIHYAKACRQFGVLTSLDGGGLRSNTHDLLAFIDVAIVAERLCEQMHLSPGEMLGYLRGRGCKVGGVTMGHHGLLWYDENGENQLLPALRVPPEKVIDTNGAGDIFHGAYVFSFLTTSDASWESHFRFARAASAYSIQHSATRRGLRRWRTSMKRRRRFRKDPGPDRQLAAGAQGETAAWAKETRGAVAS